MGEITFISFSHFSKLNCIIPGPALRAQETEIAIEIWKGTLVLTP